MLIEDKATPPRRRGGGGQRAPKLSALPTAGLHAVLLLDVSLRSLAKAIRLADELQELRLTY